MVAVLDVDASTVEDSIELSEFLIPQVHSYKQLPFCIQVYKWANNSAHTSATRGGNCPKVQYLKDALKLLDANDWRNVEDFLDPWGWQEVTLVHLAAHRGDTEMLERAVTLYANRSTVSTFVGEDKINEPLLVTDKLGRCALHYAASKGHSNVVSWILGRVEPKSSPHPQLSLEDVFGGTPLHDATLDLHVDVVKLLIDAGAPVNVCNRRGVPPFFPIPLDQYALDADKLTRYEEIVDIFISAEVDVNFAHPVTGRTMLHRAVYLNSRKATRQLLQHGADPSHKSCTGVTPVHLAAENGFYILLCDLLEYLPPSSIDTPNENGLSPLQLAAIIGNLECVRELVAKGGNLARSYCNSNRTVIDALFDFVYDRDIVAFFTDILDAQIRPLASTKNHAILNYGVLAPQGEPQMAVVTALMEAMSTTELRTIVQHPLLQAYIGKMLLRFSKAFYWFAILSMFFVIFLFSYTIDLVDSNRDCAWLRRLMLFSACILFLNLVQFLAEPKWYFRRLENWLALVSLTISIVVAIAGEFSSNASTSWVLQGLSIANPLAAIQMMVFASRSPACGYYVLLLIIVLKRILKVLFIGSSIIAGFSLSFFILFHNNEQFDNPWKAFSKTIVMMTGEYEYSDLMVTSANSFNNNTNSEYKIYSTFPPAIGRIVFIIFVIITSIVLMNLMIGIAVSDAQLLANEGRFVRLLNQVRFIADCERMTTNRFLRKVWVSPCLPQLMMSNETSNQETMWLTDKPPRHISRGVWRDIVLLCRKNRDRDQNHQTSESRWNDREASFAAIQTVLATIQSSQEMMMGQIQQLMQDRKADVQIVAPGCSRDSENKIDSNKK